jgi:hypothetical protein
LKRDLDLVRDILLWMESQEHGFAPHEGVKIEGRSEEEIGFHVHLMGQAGLIETTSNTYLESESPSAMPLSITWEGYEFLSNSKNDTVWAKARSKLLAPAGEVSFTVLLEWLKAQAMARL